MLAESVVWRGCRHGGQAIAPAQGLDFLKAGLEEEGHRAVRQLATVAMPLPIPLSFPRVFRDGLSSAGDLVRPECCPACGEYCAECTDLLTRKPSMACIAVTRSVMLNCDATDCDDG